VKGLDEKDLERLLRLHQWFVSISFELSLIYMCLAYFLQVCVQVHEFVSLDKSSFKIIIIEYEVCFVLVVYWTTKLVEGLEDQVQPGSSEEKIHKKILILSSSSS
jgi:hypothetical protein